MIGAFALNRLRREAEAKKRRAKRRPRCCYELSPFNPCGRVAVVREFVFGNPYCREHAMEKVAKFDLKMVPIKKGKR